MNRRDGLLCYVLVATCLLGALLAKAADSFSGNWTIAHSDEAGKVQFALIEHHRGGNSNPRIRLAREHLRGAGPFATRQNTTCISPSRVTPAASICQGYIDSGEGAGTFHFFAEPKYAAEMKTLGFTIDDEKQYHMAIMDVSTEFARQMKAEKLEDLDADKLIALRIFNVNVAFIEDLRKAGLPITDSEKLVAFRIHGVTPGNGQFSSSGRLPARCGHPRRHAHPRRHPRVDGPTKK